MLNKPRYQSAASQRQYDIPGVSLRGPYKRWIPQSNSRASESETEAPKASWHRPRAHESSNHIAANENQNIAPPTPSLRHQNGSLGQHSVSQSHRPDRVPNGYSSESTVHAPTQPSFPSLNIFKTQPKDTKDGSHSGSRREKLHHLAPTATLTSRLPDTQSPPVPQAKPSREAPGPFSEVASISSLTQTSTDPSPRSSTDSGHRNGNASASAAENSEHRRHGYVIWNPAVDVKHQGESTSTSRKPDNTTTYKQEDRRAKDKEDITTIAADASGSGSTGKARILESSILQKQFHPVRGGDGTHPRRTNPGTSVAEVQTRSHLQAQPLLRRHRATPHATPFSSGSHLPDVSSKNSRPSTNSSRPQPETQPLMQASQEASAKTTPFMPKNNLSSTSSSKMPHLRTASSPWPFNHALPTEQTSHKSHQISQSHHATSDWRSSSRLHGTSAPVKSPDARSSSKETSYQTSYAAVPGHLQNSQTDLPPPPSRSKFLPQIPQTDLPPPLPHKFLSRSGTLQASRAVPPAPAPTPMPSIQHFERSRPDSDPVLSPPSIEQSGQIWSSDAQASGRLAPSSVVSTQTSTLSDARGIPTWNHSVSSIDSVMTINERTNNTQMMPGRSGTLQFENSSQSLSSTSSRSTAGVVDKTLATADATPGRRLEESNESTISQNMFSQPSARTGIPATNAQGSQSPRLNQAELSDLHMVDFDATTGMSGSSHSLNAMSPAATGTWSSTLYTPQSHAGSSDVSQGSATGSAVNLGRLEQHNDLLTPLDYDVPGKPEVNDSTHVQERFVAGAWMSKHSDANMNTATFDNPSSAPKAHVKAPITEELSFPSSKYQSASSSTLNQPGKGFRSQPPTPAATPAMSTPGAWTVSSRHATTNTSIFHTPPNGKHQSINNYSRDTSTSARPAVLGTTPVPGAWTTKATPILHTGIESTSKRSPPRNSSPPTPSGQSLPPPGTGTSSSTPSSAQVDDAVISSVPTHSVSTRVPISGHPSTPAPIRTVLRPTPPPLSISSTSPDTDSLLTPSSLNSPRSTLLLPQSQPAATITSMPTMTAEENKYQRKGGFFGFLRPKPPVYEIWTPPSRNPKEKERKTEESSKDHSSSPPKVKPSPAMPIPRPKSPKIFSAFKLFSRRHRTVSSASLDVLDGTAANTVLNSPASSMRADPPDPPSPPLRDPILATQEWRNREAAELLVSGRKRRPRPGVTFDCPEDIAPANIVPSRLRLTRLLIEDDDDF